MRGSAWSPERGFPSPNHLEAFATVTHAATTKHMGKLVSLLDILTKPHAYCCIFILWFLPLVPENVGHLGLAGQLLRVHPPRLSPRPLDASYSLVGFGSSPADQSFGEKFYFKGIPLISSFGSTIEAIVFVLCWSIHSGETHKSLGEAAIWQPGWTSVREGCICTSYVKPIGCFFYSFLRIRLKI